MTILVPPPPRVDFVEIKQDPSGRTRGVITRPWLLYLQDLFTRVGGAVAPSTTELEVMIDEAVTNAQIARTTASQALASASRDVRAGSGIDIARDAQGSVISVAAEQFIASIIPFLPKPAVPPDVRAGSGVSLTKDAQGYVISSTGGAVFDDMQNIIANRVYGG